jgi:dTDP-4-amino-4,6-dideoxygalactose transaminase
MKTINQLALLGGTPAFAQPLHVGRPNIPDRARFLERVNAALDRRWLTNRGPLVLEFEQAIANYIGVRHCIAMCNATIALEIAARAAGLQGEVIVPSMTFVATAHALQWVGLTPVFVDVDPATHNLDPASVESAISPRTTGILGVHAWGTPCAIEPLTAIARRYGLTLLFDAAHAFGCSHRGRMLGSFGHAEVLSFHATKFFNTLEGGAIVTNDDELARRARLMQNFGFEDYDTVITLGTNGKMNEVSAAMGLTALEDLDAFVAANRRNYERYRSELRGLPGVAVFEHDGTECHNFQYVVLEIDRGTSGLGRDDLVRVLWAENIFARRYFHPGCHRMEPYRSRMAPPQRALPVTESLVQRTLLLPTGSAVGEEDVIAVCDIVRAAIAHSDGIQARLRAREARAAA